MDYTYKDIKEAFRRVGVERGRVISLKSDLRLLGSYETSGREEVLKAHFDALTDIVDLNVGTIVVPTASLNLCNTDTVYDPANTPGEWGVLTNYIRRLDGAVRSFHPFNSYAAIGRDAQYICSEVSRHDYGPETPKARMIDMDALVLSVGVQPRLVCTFIHHVEMIMGVPYRYTREYMHPVLRDGDVRVEPFYKYVWYKQCNLKRDRLKKIFKLYEDADNTLRYAPLGRGRVSSFSLKHFFDFCIRLFRDDIYIWLSELPTIRPYAEWM